MPCALQQGSEASHHEYVTYCYVWTIHNKTSCVVHAQATCLNEHNRRPEGLALVALLKQDTIRSHES